MWSTYRYFFRTAACYCYRHTNLEVLQLSFVRFYTIATLSDYNGGDKIYSLKLRRNVKQKTRGGWGSFKTIKAKIRKGLVGYQNKILYFLYQDVGQISHKFYSYIRFSYYASYIRFSYSTFKFLMLEGNLCIHNYASLLIHDWISSPYLTVLKK